MGYDYGGVRTEYEQFGGSGDIGRRVLKCTKCPYRNAEKGRMQVRLPRRIEI